jgi:hypothetical protein
MAYLDKETKQNMDEQVKKVAKKYGLKITTRREHYSSYNIYIREGKIDFGTTYKQMNPYYIKENYSGIVAEVLEELKKIVFGNGYHNNSDAMRDYFDYSWYVKIQVGEWDKPYKLAYANN